MCHLLRQTNTKYILLDICLRISLKLSLNTAFHQQLHFLNDLCQLIAQKR